MTTPTPAPAPVESAATKIARYRKAIVAVVGQALTFATIYYGDTRWVAGAVAIAAALGVWQVPNEPPKPK
jgi:hypothetical protein